MGQESDKSVGKIIKLIYLSAQEINEKTEKYKSPEINILCCYEVLLLKKTLQFLLKYNKQNTLATKNGKQHH